MGFTGFYWVLQGLNGFSVGFQWVLLEFGLKQSYQQVFLQGFLGFLKVYRVLPDFYRVLWSLTRWKKVLPGFIESNPNENGLTGVYWVFMG